MRSLSFRARRIKSAAVQAGEPKARIRERWLATPRSEFRIPNFTGVEHLGDVRMVHQCQGLPLGLEAGHDFAGVHAGLDDLQGDRAADGLFLVGHVNDAHAALAEQLAKLVGAD